MIRVPMTQEGAEALRAELNKLKFETRPQIIKSISEARAHGDLKENAEYHAAREQQGFAEGRIQEIESKLSHAQIIDVSKMDNSGKVIFGSTVHMLNIDTDDEVTYQVVGEDEADIKISKISVTSPIARAIIGKEIGECIEVTTPSGKVSYEIVNVELI